MFRGKQKHKKELQIYQQFLILIIELIYIFVVKCILDHYYEINMSFFFRRLLFDDIISITLNTFVMPLCNEMV
jgi:hypothetical protein